MYHQATEQEHRRSQGAQWMTQRGYSVPRIPDLKTHSDGGMESTLVSVMKDGHIGCDHAHILGASKVPTSEDSPSCLDRCQSCYQMGLYLRLPCHQRRRFNENHPVHEDHFLLQGSWFNQTTAFYFDAGMDLDPPWGVETTARGLLYASREVDDERQETPNLQQTRNFANAVALFGDYDLRTVEGIAATHKRICDTLVFTQDRPVSPEDPFTWAEHGVEMGVVYPSIIIIAYNDLKDWKNRTEAECRHYLFKESTVMLVRTGDEAHLSAPIDLSGLGGVTQPSGNDKQQFVNIRLQTAVRFIMDLERREQEHSSRLTAMKRILDEETFRDADAWAMKALEAAERHGSIDRNKETWEAVRRARARLENEPFATGGLLARTDDELREVRRWETKQQSK